MVSEALVRRQGGACGGTEAGELFGELVGRLGESDVGQAHALVSRMRLSVASSVLTTATCSSKKASVKTGGWKKVIMSQAYTHSSAMPELRTPRQRIKCVYGLGAVPLPRTVEDPGPLSAPRAGQRPCVQTVRGCVM